MYYLIFNLWDLFSKEIHDFLYELNCLTHFNNNHSLLDYVTINRIPTNIPCREIIRERTISRRDFFTTCHEKPFHEIVRCREIVCVVCTFSYLLSESQFKRCISQSFGVTVSASDFNQLKRTYGSGTNVGMINYRAFVNSLQNGMGSFLI